MSIDLKTKNEEAPVAPTNNKATTHQRTNSLAEQIAQNWRAMPQEEQHRWTAATEAVEADSAFEPLHLHLEPRPLPADRELDIEQFPTEPQFPTDDSTNNTTLWFADNLLFLPVVRPVAGPTMLPPWRRPRAFSGGLKNVSLITFLPLAPDEDEEDEEDEEADRIALKSEKHSQTFDAPTLADRKAGAEAEAEAADERDDSLCQRPSWMWVQCPLEAPIRGAHWELGMHERFRTTGDIPAHLHSWSW
ncbi:hypothetical protein GSI_04915 [Ganoderma sinense ZZ0214-1]|uniref:Uncharacterized protein n=1 Tax=Ganoderma sinense ZZ0214-1 TaxID=1077348 RepID=A0A2G8SGV6_9APHY|nr:hypothetical protein GSI_04915 [Ganoderma sinense ZZ0214-1]